MSTKRKKRIVIVKTNKSISISVKYIRGIYLNTYRAVDYTYYNLLVRIAVEML